MCDGSPNGTSPARDPAASVISDLTIPTFWMLLRHNDRLRARLQECVLTDASCLVPVSFPIPVSGLDLCIYIHEYKYN